MKTKICLVLALLLVVTVPLCAASGVDPVQSHERIAVGESIERVSELKDDRITVVSFIVEKGEKVKLRYEVEAMEEYGDDVIAWVIMPEEVYEDGIGNWDEDDFIDFGQGPFVHRTLFLDEPNVYYFIVAVDCLNQLTISYKVELEDATPAPAPSPTPTP
ncbi:MAG: hypothetical protein KAX30_02980, partial [Candidatus Atribacteria bacterium]|nr:hypothetical protein [Candidatus Atribacteria bacterium]